MNIQLGSHKDGSSPKVEDEIGGISTKSVWKGGGKIFGDAEFERLKKRWA